jgi:23S rRNA pseudouridine1911/1915/1917 synthase
MSARRLNITIDQQQAGKTVHVLLRYQIGLSGTVLRRIKWLEDGILLDGKRVTTRAIVQAGQELSVRLSDPEQSNEIPPVELPLKIVYEDRDIVIVDKAAGMPSHPGAGHWDDTLGNGLVAHWRNTDPEANFHPVHRLDKGTSGLMVAAKHPFAQEKLKQQLHTKEFQRGYLAICDGIPEPASGVIRAPISRQDNSVLKREVSPDGAPAVTHYETLSVAENRALVHLELETGRTHQIRVHMAYLGVPLTGDFLYGVENQDLISRPALHSAELSLLHPVTGEPMSFLSPIPEDMAKLMKKTQEIQRKIKAN